MPATASVEPDNAPRDARMDLYARCPRTIPATEGRRGYNGNDNEHRRLAIAVMLTRRVEIDFSVLSSTSMSPRGTTTVDLPGQIESIGTTAYELAI